MTTPSEKKRFLGLTYTEIGILAILLCVGCVLVGVIFRTFIARNLLSSFIPVSNSNFPPERFLVVIRTMMFI
jgi:hypothetical protein